MEIGNYLNQISLLELGSQREAPDITVLEDFNQLCHDGLPGCPVDLPALIRFALSEPVREDLLELSAVRHSLPLLGPPAVSSFNDDWQRVVSGNAVHLSHCYLASIDVLQDDIQDVFSYHCLNIPDMCHLSMKHKPEVCYS